VCRLNKVQEGFIQGIFTAEESRQRTLEAREKVENDIVDFDPWGALLLMAHSMDHSRDIIPARVRSNATLGTSM
jgi:hypothetical protein